MIPAVTHRRLLGAALRASVAAQPLSERRARLDSLRSRGELTGLAAAANRHGIAGYVRQVCEGTDILPAAEEVELLRIYHGSLALHLKTLAGLRSIQVALNDHVHNWFVIKGPVLTEPVHGRPDLRTYGDLDVVVPAQTLGLALDVLEALGAETLDRNWHLLARELRGEVHLRLSGGTIVDLHWHLLNDGAVRSSFAVPMNELFERVRPVRVGQMEVPTLDPVDTLLHLALHAVLSGGHRLVWVKDVERAAALDTDWDEVVRRSRQWRIGPVVGGGLAQARRVLGADVPADAIHALVPSRLWRSVAAAANRFAPVELESGEASLGRIVARSTRGTAGTSIAALLSKTLKRAKTWESVEARVQRGLDPASCGSMLFDAGGRPAREAFLRALADTPEAS